MVRYAIFRAFLTPLVILLEVVVRRWHDQLVPDVREDTLGVVWEGLSRWHLMSMLQVAL